MRTIIKEYQVYKFHELGEEGRQKALENLYDLNVDHEWWQFPYEAAEMVEMKITEFNLDRGRYCKIEMSNAYETACLIRDDHGSMPDAYKKAIEFIMDWDNLVVKYSDGVNLNEVSEENEGDFDEEADDLEREFRQDLEECYLSLLIGEYEYLTSEEAIIECIEANDYDFTEDGELF